MAQHALSDGRIAIIAPPSLDDAAALATYTEAVAGESPFLTFGPGELGLTADKERAFLEAGLADGGYMRKAVVDGEIAGFINLRRGERPRVRHTGEFGVSVRRAYWGLGIGGLLVQDLLRWATAAGMRKMNLRVRADNARGRGLYRKLGFSEEGLCTRAYLIDGTFYDEVLMGIALDAAPD